LEEGNKTFDVSGGREAAFFFAMRTGGTSMGVIPKGRHWKRKTLNLFGLVVKDLLATSVRCRTSMHE
jgi:hypothetical protein